MGDLATIYSPRPDEPTEATFRGCADAGVDVALERCGPGSKGLRARIVWPDLYVTCEVAIDDVQRPVAALLAYAREMSTDPADPLPSRIQASQQVLALRVEPGFDDEGRAEALLSGLLRERDGLVFRGGRVLDGAGACLLAPPAPDPTDEDPQPPSPLRVARRALVLCAVVCRASLEQEPSPARAEELQERLLAWLEANDLGGELEEHERELIEADVGSLPRQRAIDASWRSEGLAVLGWALGGYDLPPHDEQADPQEIAQSLGFLEDCPARGLDGPRLRDEVELERLSRRLTCLHWRLREFTSRPGALDLKETAGLAFTAEVDLEGVPLLDGDLALRGAAISACEQDVVTECASIAFERHQAINWLAGHHDVYSEVDTST